MELYTLMRIAWALAASLCGTASAPAFPADNIPYCSDGFDEPARIVLTETNSMFLQEGDKPEIHFDAPDKVTLSVGKKTEVFSFHEPGEDSIPLIYSPETVPTTVALGAEAYLAEAKIGKTTVILFADRVFWPCEK